MSSTLDNPAPVTPVRTAVDFRPYQMPIFNDRGPGVIILHWSRQIGKSFSLAAWAVDRLLENEMQGHLVTVLSNSRENGVEFLLKCAAVCRLIGQKYNLEETSPNTPFQQMRMEIRVKRKGQIGRIKVLAANPRTARGFSGDLILDEFAFHEDSAATRDEAGHADGFWSLALAVRAGEISGAPFAYQRVVLPNRPPPVFDRRHKGLIG